MNTTPIAGTGSSAEPIVPSGELEPEVSPTPEVQEPETSTPPEGEVTPPEPGKEGQQEPLEGKEDGRVIPKWMKELQQANPEAYKRAKADFFEMRDRRSVHPTTQAAREDRDLVQSLGGKEGVTKMREDVSFFHTAAQQFTKGDPAFVQDLWEEDPIAAALHVPVMLDTFKTKDLDGYKSTIAKLWDGEFQGVGFGKALRSLQDAIKGKNTEDAMGVLDSIIGWYNSIGEVAKKAEDPRVKTLLAERQKRQEAEQQTQNETFLKNYRTEAVNQTVGDAAKVFDSFFKGKKIDAEDRNDLLREALSVANRAVMADTKHATDRDAHLANGDSHSALQLTRARFAREFPDAVKRVARRYGLVSGTPAQGTVTPQKQTPQGPRIEPGWEAISRRPDPTEIDRDRTPNDMIISRKAYLKNGKKVDWSKWASQQV